METVLEKLETETTTRITDKVRFLLVSKGSWGNSKTIKSSTLNLDPINEREPDFSDFSYSDTPKPKTDPRWVYVSKYLLSSAHFNAIQKSDELLGFKLDRLAVPSPLRGARMIPIKNLVEADKLLTAHVAERKALIDTWFESGDYPKEIENSKERLGPRFNIEDYPSVEELRRKLDRFSWRWFQIGPADLQEVNREIFIREAEKNEAQWKEVGEEISRMQRLMMQELVTNLADRLKQEPGKRKALRADSFNAIKEFLCGFSAKNITEDKDLERLVDRVQQLTEGIDPETVKTSDVLRDKMEKEFTEIKTNVDALVVAGPVRRVRF